MNLRRGLIEPFRLDLEGWAAHGWTRQPVRGRDAAVLLFRFAGVRAALIHRVAHFLRANHVPALPTVCGAVNLALHGLDIPPDVRVGGGLYLPHPVGTVIMAQRIGENVEIQSGVNVGMRNTPEFPIVEDGAFLGAGCKVFGAIRVGQGARVGANAVVLCDVPDGQTAVGIPARVTGR